MGPGPGGGVERLDGEDDYRGCYDPVLTIYHFYYTNLTTPTKFITKDGEKHENRMFANNVKHNIV